MRFTILGCVRALIVLTSVSTKLKNLESRAGLPFFRIFTAKYYPVALSWPNLTLELAPLPSVRINWYLPSVEGILI